VNVKPSSGSNVRGMPGFGPVPGDEKVVVFVGRTGAGDGDALRTGGEYQVEERRAALETRHRPERSSASWGRDPARMFGRRRSP